MLVVPTYPLPDLRVSRHAGDFFQHWLGNKQIKIPFAPCGDDSAGCAVRQHQAGQQHIGIEDDAQDQRFLAAATGTSG